MLYLTNYVVPYWWCMLSYRFASIIISTCLLVVEKLKMLSGYSTALSPTISPLNTHGEILGGISIILFASSSELIMNLDRMIHFCFNLIYIKLFLGFNLVQDFFVHIYWRQEPTSASTIICIREPRTSICKSGRNDYNHFGTYFMHGLTGANITSLCVTKHESHS